MSSDVGTWMVLLPPCCQAQVAESDDDACRPRLSPVACRASRSAAALLRQEDSASNAPSEMPVQCVRLRSLQPAAPSPQWFSMVHEPSKISENGLSLHENAINRAWHQLTSLGACGLQRSALQHYKEGRGSR